LLGNRALGSLVNVENKYWFSYPGRSEAFCGYYDSAINSNEYPDNPNTNVLEFIDRQPGFHGKVVTFSSWDADAHIFNRDRNGMLVNIYGEDVEDDIFGKGERMDVSTYAMAKAYLLASHPRVLYIDLGDPDDFAHAGESFYRDRTDVLVFPDHGRGIGAQWTDHGSETEHSNETYFLAMGPGVAAKGEVKGGSQIYEAQYAQTIGMLLGVRFTASHPVAAAVQGLGGK
jgi:hypothetical protein